MKEPFCSFKQILDVIRKKDIYCIIENRPEKYLFGTKNYGEIIGYRNRADGDRWDIIAAGYNKYLDRYKQYKIKGILGIFVLENGNHKIIVKLDIPGYDEVYKNIELNKYAKKYINYTKVKGFLI